jgi:acetolactate synthase I/II/III large subunit
MRLADAVISSLIQFGVKETFYVTGRGSLFLTDAVARDPQILGMAVHHEQSAGYAAIAATVASKRPSSCILSTGVGSTNAISAVLSAWQDEVPVFFISGQNHSNSSTAITGEGIRSYGEQEANISEIVRSITNFSITVSDPSKIWEIMDSAQRAANGKRMGPVWIDIPLDFQSARVRSGEGTLTPEPVQEKMFNGQELFRSATEEQEVSARDALLMVSNAARPIVLLGNGSVWAGRNDLTQFLNQLGIPVVYESAAAGVYSTVNQASIGSVGTLGCSRAGNFAIQNSDLILALGSQFRTSLTGEDEKAFAPVAKIVSVDHDRSQLRNQFKNRVLSVNLGVAEFLNEAKQASLVGKKSSTWLQKCLEWKTEMPKFPSESPKTKVDLYQLAEELPLLAPKDAIFVTDSGFVELILPTNSPFTPGQEVVHPHSQGAMGFALPASLGVSKATDRPVVAVIGDGSIMMNIQELQTIVEHQPNTKVLVISNNAYAIIRRRQEELFRSRTIGTDSSNGVSLPSFEKLASAFGLPFLEVDQLDESTRPSLARFLSEPGPGICEIAGLENQDYIRQGSRMLSSGAHVLRPIHDLAPFLSEEYINSQMILGN